MGLLALGILFLVHGAQGNPADHGALSDRHVSISIRSLGLRAPISNAPGNVTSYVGLAGLAPISLSTDRQSYFAEISAGVIPFRVVLDTASSDLWLFSSACNSASCKKGPRYPLAYPSATFGTINSNATLFRESYADGSFASGFIAQESIQLANITISNQAFAVVTDSNVTLTDMTSGIIGLGFPRLSSISHSVSNATPFFATLAQRGIVKYPIFALSLTRNSTGTLSLGAIDASVMVNASQIGWNKVAQFPPFANEVNVSRYLQWAIPMTGFSVNGTYLPTQPTYPNVNRNTSLALFDIGTPGIYGPFQDVARLFSLVNGARLVDTNGQWAVPCTTAVPISFTFGNRNYSLLPADYIVGSTSGSPEVCLAWPRALPPSADGIDWQFGEVFLRSVYSIFSYGIDGKEPPMIGLYPLPVSPASSNGTNNTTSLPSFSPITIPTTLPNFLVPTPTFGIPSYTFNSSESVSVGGIVSSGLATSTYKALLASTALDATALPLVNAASNASSASAFATTAAAMTLGIPPGWNGATGHRPPWTLLRVLMISLLLWTVHSLFLLV